MSNVRVSYRLALLVLVGTYSAVVFHIFPLRQLANSNPFMREDYPIHFYDAAMVSSLILHKGKTWGYDPFLMAGYPIGTLYSMDNKATELFVALLRFIGPAQAFKSYVVVGYLCMPFLFWLAARNFGASREQSTFSLCAWLVFTACEKLTVTFTAFGGFNYLFAVCLMFLLASLLYRILWQSIDRATMLWFFGGATFFWVHAYSCPLFLVLGLAVVLSCPQKIAKARIVFLLLWVLIALLVNAPWIALTIEFWYTKTLSQAYPYFQPTGIAGIWDDLIDPTMRIRKPLVLLALAGVFFSRKVPHAHRVCYIAAAVFLVVAYLGHHIPFGGHLEAYRFVLPAFTCLCLPAGYGLGQLLALVHRRRIVPVLFMLCLVATSTLVPFRSTYPLFPASLWSLRIHSEYDERALKLVDYLKTNTTKQGRILIEDAGYEVGGMQYFDSYFLGVLPYLIDREIIGGPQPDTPLIFHHADFTNGKLFHRSIESYTAEELSAYLDAYNIQWIVAWSTISKDVLGSLPQSMVQYVTTIDKFDIYKVAAPASFFLKGSGILTSSLDKLELRNCSEGEIVLKYHYVDGLKTNGVRKAEPFPVLNDPAGFIRLVNDPYSPTITIETRSMWTLR